MAHPFAKFAGILKQLAPTVLTAVGGPAGAIAGQLIRKATGVASDADLEKVVGDALATPEGLEKIKLAEIELKRFEQESGIKFAELDVQDLESARNHDIEAQKQGDQTTRQMAWLLVGAFVALSAAVVVANLMGLGMTESTLLGSIIGYLLGEAKQVTAFYFGSSRGSREKDATLAAVAKE